jgi:low affinity Fe/Cu permease
MKKVFTTTVFLLIAGVIFAQNRTKDELAINAQIDAMIYS